MTLKVTCAEFLGIDRMDEDELRDSVLDLLAENAKLREYAKLMHSHIKECCDACGERGICDVNALTRELEIEVDE